MLQPVELLELINNDEFCKFLQELEPQLSNKEPVIELVDFNFIKKPNSKIFLKYLVAQGKELIKVTDAHYLVKKNNHVVSIQDADLYKNLELTMSDRIQLTSGFATVIGYSLELDNILLFIYDHSKDVSTLKIDSKEHLQRVISAASQINSQNMPNLFVEKFVDRLISAIKNQDEKKLNDVLSALWLYAKQHVQLDVNQVLSYIPLIHAVLGIGNYELLFCFFRQVTNNQKLFHAEIYQNFLQYYIVNLIPTKLSSPTFNNYEETIINHLLDNLRNLFAEGILDSNVINTDLYEKIEKRFANEKQPQGKKSTLYLLESVKAFYKMLNEATSVQDLTEYLTDAINHDPTMALKLFNGFIQAALTSEHSFDTSKIKPLLRILLNICSDEKDERHEQLRSLFEMIYMPLLGFEVDKVERKTIFQSNEEKFVFFKQHFTKLIPGLSTMDAKDNTSWFSQTNNNNNTASSSSIQESHTTRLSQVDNDEDTIVSSSNPIDQEDHVSEIAQLEFLIYDLPKCNNYQADYKTILALLIKVPAEEFANSPNNIKLLQHVNNNTDMFLFATTEFLRGKLHTSDFKKLFEERPEYEFLLGFQSFRQGSIPNPISFKYKQNKSVITFLENLTKRCSDIPDLALYLGFLYSNPQLAFHDDSKTKYWLNFTENNETTSSTLIEYYNNNNQLNYCDYLKNLRQKGISNMPSITPPPIEKDLVRNTFIEIKKILSKKKKPDQQPRDFLINFKSSLVSLIKNLNEKYSQLAKQYIATKNADAGSNAKKVGLQLDYAQEFLKFLSLFEENLPNANSLSQLLNLFKSNLSAVDDFEILNEFIDSQLIKFSDQKKNNNSLFSGLFKK